MLAIADGLERCHDQAREFDHVLRRRMVLLYGSRSAQDFGVVCSEGVPHWCIAAPMFRARPVRCECGEMRRAWIALVAVEPVLRIVKMQFEHVPVSRDFGQD